MTVTYQIFRDTAHSYALRNSSTGQFEHDGFVSIVAALDFFNLHFGWRPDYRLDHEIIEPARRAL